jgi:hypothetical protein
MTNSFLFFHYDLLLIWLKYACILRIPLTLHLTFPAMRAL